MTQSTGDCPRVQASAVGTRVAQARFHADPINRYPGQVGRTMIEPPDILLGVLALGTLILAYALVRWGSRQRTLHRAESISRSLTSDPARLPMSADLRDRLERYRIARVRAGLGVPSDLDEAADALVREHRLNQLERR